MIVNAISIVQHVIHIKNGIIKHVNANVKIIVHPKKDFSWNPSTCICENSKYLKSIADRLQSFDLTMGNVSTKYTNTIATNVTSSASINCHNKKVRDFYL